MSERQTDPGKGRRAGRIAGAAILLLGLVIGLAIAVDPANLYLWIKALHIVAVISWMAGLFYLPRLFIYHTDAAPGSESSESFKVMEQRLLRIIMNPAMMLTWIFGLYLAWSGFSFSGGWLHAKIALVLLLTLVHVFMSQAVRIFGRDGPRRSARFWRIVNEAPTLLMIAIVILVVVKPF